MSRKKPDSPTSGGSGADDGSAFVLNIGPGLLVFVDVAELQKGIAVHIEDLMTTAPRVPDHIEFPRADGSSETVAVSAIGNWIDANAPTFRKEALEVAMRQPLIDGARGAVDVIDDALELAAEETIVAIAIEAFRSTAASLSDAAGYPGLSQNSDMRAYLDYLRRAMFDSAEAARQSRMPPPATGRPAAKREARALRLFRLLADSALPFFESACKARETSPRSWLADVRSTEFYAKQSQGCRSTLDEVLEGLANGSDLPIDEERPKDFALCYAYFSMQRAGTWKSIASTDAAPAARTLRLLYAEAVANDAQIASTLNQ